MMRIGPEALMVTYRIDYRAELAQYARAEFAETDPCRVEAMLRDDLEYLPVRRSPAQRLLRWAREGLGRAEPRVATTLAARPIAIVTEAERVGATRPLAGATLAALPALQGGGRPTGASTPIAAAPACARG
jgi:hypothetical protein